VELATCAAEPLNGGRGATRPTGGGHAIDGGAAESEGDEDRVGGPWTWSLSGVKTRLGSA